jgi:hypothetical protein
MALVFQGFHKSRRAWIKVDLCYCPTSRAFAAGSLLIAMVVDLLLARRLF